MKLNKKKLCIIILIISIIILFLLYYLINNNESYETNLTMKDITQNLQEETNAIPNNTIEAIVEEPVGKCPSESDIVNFCINYKSCCYTNSNSNSNDCICNHPIVKNCRSQFEKCINNQDDFHNQNVMNEPIARQLLINYIN